MVTVHGSWVQGIVAGDGHKVKGRKVLRRADVALSYSVMKRIPANSSISFILATLFSK